MPAGFAIRSTRSCLRGWKAKGLEPSPPANGNTLLRRLSLDLIGLPPTLDELAAFEKAEPEAAYRP